ncbi:MAG: site-specific integrase [Oscillospiraceae bacterium]|nr:site-specific integrase [Oscillospiraceae bacterium]
MADFQVFINELAACNPNTGRPSSKKLIKDVIRTMNGILRYAAANGIPGVINFCDAVIIPKQATVGVRRALTEIEQQRILETEHQVKLPAMIMMFSGLRLGEALALHWDDIDFDNATISVNKTLVFDENNKGAITSGGKTKNAIRYVYIPPILVDYLKQEKAKSQTELICVKADGKPHTKTSWKKRWDSYILELNLKYGYGNKLNRHNGRIKATQLPLKIERFTAHFLRHTYATMLYLQGVDAVTAKQIMGHADVSTTINIYTDLQNFNRKNLSDEYKEKLKNEYKIDYSL